MGRLIGKGLLNPSPASATAPAVTPDISDRKLLRQGAGPDDGGEGILSAVGEMLRAGFPESFGLPCSLSPDSGAPEMLSPLESVSDFLFLLRRKLPLSNIFSQFGSSVQ